MDWGEYKALCDRPDYWSAWMANQCQELLQRSVVADADGVATKLRQDLRRPALARPVDHKGGVETWMYQVSLSKAQCHILMQVIDQAQEQGCKTSGTQIRGLGGFLANCQELLQFRQASELSSRRNHG